MSNQDQPGVSPAVAESVADANLKVVGDAPAEGLGVLYQALSHSTGLAFENAGNSQHQQFMSAQSATVQGVSLLYTLDTAEQAVAPSNLNLSALPQYMIAMLGAIEAFSRNQSTVRVRDDESISVDNRTFVEITQEQEESM